MENEVAELTIAGELGGGRRSWVGRKREGRKELERKSRASSFLQPPPSPCRKIIFKLLP